MIPVYVAEPITNDQVQVPQEIVIECRGRGKLDTLQCYWEKMGYFSSIYPIPVIPYTSILDEMK